MIYIVNESISILRLLHFFTIDCNKKSVKASQRELNLCSKSFFMCTLLYIYFPNSPSYKIIQKYSFGGEFNIQYNVWTTKILCYRMATLGQKGLTSCTIFYNHHGKILLSPDQYVWMPNCAHKLYDMMQDFHMVDLPDVFEVWNLLHILFELWLFVINLEITSKLIYLFWNYFCNGSLALEEFSPPRRSLFQYKRPFYVLVSKESLSICWLKDFNLSLTTWLRFSFHLMNLLKSKITESVPTSAVNTGSIVLITA